MQGGAGPDRRAMLAAVTEIAGIPCGSDGWMSIFPAHTVEACCDTTLSECHASELLLCVCPSRRPLPAMLLRSAGHLSMRWKPGVVQGLSAATPALLTIAR